MKQKLLTCTVPCYNSAEYMRKCIESLLVGGEEVEIVIVNDGSSDGTLAIAREYEAAHPSVVRVVDKENGGHGSGVNAGLERATGLYFKVVDEETKMDVNLVSRPVKLSVGRELVSFLKERPELNFRIN